MAILGTYVGSFRTPLGPLGVTGGTVTTSGIYTIHTFTSSGTLIVSGTGDIDYLIVGGGTGSKSQSGAETDFVGGGGAGGNLKEIFNYTISSGTYTVTVGAGGARHTSEAGVDSSIATIDSALGAPSQSAMSGFKDGRNSRSFSGGIGDATEPNSKAGGGAGNSQNGKNNTSTRGGNGGNGTLATITNIRYGGGGGGGGNANNNSGGFGVDGGGDGGGGSALPNGQNGIANRGGGGGGRRRGSTASLIGGNGGSGIVVIRYVTP